MLLLKKLFYVLVFLLCFATVFVVWLIKDQGISSDAWKDYETAKVVVDDYGIPTIAAPSWQRLIEAQGYVVASERLWQMDLMRRFAAGKLSEWFGKDALGHDTKRVQENWQGVAENAVAHMTPEELEFCELYAKGVNQFIKENSGSWGMEYTILQVNPEPWRCIDSFLVVLNMSEQLTGHADEEAREWIWKKNLSEKWQNVLFPKFHPWAKPLIGDPQPLSILDIPPPEEYIPMQPLTEAETKAKLLFAESFYPGSNAWVWSHADSKKVFLANDTHIGYTVPMPWFANRLRIDDNTWVVGTSIPGIPGIIIGMNQNIAWGFTNEGDDVDDWLAERVNEQKGEYLSRGLGNQEFWRKISKKKYVINVRDEEPVEVEAWFTHRGPLARRKLLGNQYYSRQWLALREGVLNLPAVKINQARDWLEFNAAFDRMMMPHQAVAYADRLGNIGFRSAGVSIKRRGSTRTPVDAELGEWVDLEDVAVQHKILLSPEMKSAPKAKFLALANSQLWRDEYGERWATDDRRERIAEMLASKDDFSVSDFEDFQRDTHSRYFKEVLAWLMREVDDTTASSQRQELFTLWQNWDGKAESSPQIFTHAMEIDNQLTNVLLARVRNHFLKDVRAKDLPTYEFIRRRAVVLNIMDKRVGMDTFGLSSTEVANFLVRDLIAKLEKEKVALQRSGDEPFTYLDINQWQTQHPFVGKIPLIGRLFKVTPYSQTGWAMLVRVEEPKRGASFRIVWDLSDIKKSTWNFPVGQSGHIRSKNYRNLQKRWFEGKSIKVFDASFNWH